MRSIKVVGQATDFPLDYHALVYLQRYLEMQHAREVTLRPWETDTCPECGNIPDNDTPYAHIVDSAGKVLIGCELYHIVNPNACGISEPDWSDWTIPPRPIDPLSFVGSAGLV